MENFVSDHIKPKNWAFDDKRQRYRLSKLLGFETTKNSFFRLTKAKEWNQKTSSSEGYKKFCLWLQKQKWSGICNQIKKSHIE